MTKLPPNTIAGDSIVVYLDAQTLEPLSKEEWAKRKAQQWHAENGKWPSVNQLAIAASVSHGTAQNALRLARC